jgi:polyhydroxyalkanoate synthase
MEDKARMPTDAERRPPGSDQPRQRKSKPERNATREGDATAPDSPAKSATKPKKPRPVPATAAPVAPRAPAPSPAPASSAALTTPPPHIEPKRQIETGAAPPPAPAQTDTAAAYASHIDVDALTRNFARLVEEGGRAMAAYLKPREEGTTKTSYSDQVADAVKTLGQVMEYWYADPQRAVEIQARLGRSYLDLFARASRRLAGEPTEPLAEPDPRDKRFSDPEWSSNQYFDFLKQAYLVTADWAKHLVRDAGELDPAVREKADFYMRQIVSAMSPSNFIFTNPELLRTTLNQNAENLVRGAHMLAEDIAAGGGDLKIRQSDLATFEVGRNLAITPGKVIYQNALMQLIQYEPTTERVRRRPLMIVPPWINKFYVLDLTPDKSFVKWCVDQGLTVFMISWVNPDEHLANKSFADYMHEGPLQALDVIAEITGEERIDTVGYCVGGTLLAVTLANMAAKGDDSVASATFLAAQVDFANAGDLKVFAASEEQVAAIERQMDERGYLEGSKMATVFNLLRSDDLVWPYVINNYVKGEAPFPFDLLYWNADATRMPAANHSFYLRNCYLENNITKRRMEIDGLKIDLGQVRVPIYNVATREDHIAPAKSVYLGSSYFGAPVRFVLSGSGHIAGIVNPPAKMKYQYWTGAAPQGDDVEAWIGKAVEHPGSWWSDWIAWIKAQAGEEVAARPPGGGKRTPIEDAPGSYVRVRGQ